MTNTLRSIIARHRTNFDQRSYDHALRGEPIKLARGSPEHAAAFRRRPQWYWHLAVGPTGRRATYLDLIRREAAERLGRDAGEAIETLL